MPRPSTREKHEASLAVIRMRKAFGWTQTELALKVGVAVQTVGRWESYDPPRGDTLERLADFADNAGYAKGDDFRYLIEAERGERRPIWFGVSTEEESQVTMAVLDLLRNPRWAHLKKPLMRDLKPVLDAWAGGFAEHRRIMEALADEIIEPEPTVKTKGKKK